MAIYFAIMGTSNLGVIYALNFDAYQEFLANSLESEIDFSGALTNNWSDELLMTQIRGKAKYPVPIEPASYFERAKMQKSVFLLDLSLSDSLDETLASTGTGVLQKIEFPPSVLSEAYSEISLMNIDGYHLFNGLDGAVMKSKELLMGLNFNRHHK